MIFLIVLATLFVINTNPALSTECRYESDVIPEIKDKRLDVFLGLNDEPIVINKLKSFTSITVQTNPFRVVLFDEPDDVMTITTIDNKSQKALFSEILNIRNVCEESSIAILQKFVGGIDGQIKLHIEQEISAFHF